MILTPEIGPVIILTLFDDGSPDRAGTREKVEQSLSVAPSDRALQCGQVFGKTLEHFEDRVLVGQKHIAPHCRVGGCDAGEIAKATG